MKIHKDTKQRIEWLSNLYREILKEVGGNEKVAEIIYRRVVYEEK